MEKALLLTEPAGLSEAGKLLAQGLDFFGVSASQLTLGEFLAGGDAGDDNSKFRLLCSAGTFLKLVVALEKKAGGIRFWQKNVHSAFVYAAGDSLALEKVAAQITGDKVSLVQTNQAAEWRVTDRFPEFCKSMGGIRVTSTANVPEKGFVFDEAKADAVNLISSGRNVAFVKLAHQTVPVFLSTAASIIDIQAGLAGRDFDIRQNFFTATPLVMYVKWAFARTVWQPSETGACLVIDDPLLKPRYGFLNFQHLLDLMRRHNFSTSIAFIPWNWWRSAAKIVRLFKENPARLSLSIHGCDHTGGEFGIQNRERLAWKSKQATQRMTRHQSKTGLAHDAVMVFPQGVFSEAAMGVLKHGDFIGVVNSEVISTDPKPRPIRISDFWNVAVMNYSSFPIFTRRYPSHGVENFAFDILLGKPCIVVIHHNDCHDRCRPLVEFIDRLNALNTQLSWRNLAEVVRRSFRQRELSPGVVEIEMYGTELRVDNPSGQRKRFCIRKQESAPSTIAEIRAESQPIAWTVLQNQVAFEIELDSGESKTIRITFTRLPEKGFKAENLRYKAKAMLRRYFSEVRDNYVTRKPFST